MFFPLVLGLFKICLAFAVFIDRKFWHGGDHVRFLLDSKESATTRKVGEAARKRIMSKIHHKVKLRILIIFFWKDLIWTNFICLFSANAYERLDFYYRAALIFFMTLRITTELVLMYARVARVLG